MVQKKFILAVQGEGRGHMTQALTMCDLLIEQGHIVSSVIVGTSSRRELPNFFLEKIKAPVVQIGSPNFVTDKKNKSINIPKTLFYNLMKLGTFRKSMKTIDELIKEHQPDYVINFYDLLVGMYHKMKKPANKLICIAHQYIYFHHDFEFPEGRSLDKMAIKFYTRLTTAKNAKNLALSFYQIHTQNKDVIIVPPLLRQEVFDLKTTTENFYLVYLVNNGYFEDIIEWHFLNPGIELHCFIDQAEKLKQNYSYDKKKLFIHELNDKLFLEMMSNAKGLASTAGFESVCEAMYLGKPVMMVPVEGHYEQFCNSRDAQKAGAGIFSDKFDITKLSNFTFKQDNIWFKNWVSLAKKKIYDEIISA